MAVVRGAAPAKRTENLLGVVETRTDDMSNLFFLKRSSFTSFTTFSFKDMNFNGNSSYLKFLGNFRCYFYVNSRRYRKPVVNMILERGIKNQRVKRVNQYLFFFAHGPRWTVQAEMCPLTTINSFGNTEYGCHLGKNSVKRGRHRKIRQSCVIQRLRQKNTRSRVINCLWFWCIWNQILTLHYQDVLPCWQRLGSRFYWVLGIRNSIDITVKNCKYVLTSEIFHFSDKSSERCRIMKCLFSWIYLWKNLITFIFMNRRKTYSMEVFLSKNYRITGGFYLVVSICTQPSLVVQVFFFMSHVCRSLSNYRVFTGFQQAFDGK